MGYAMRTDRYRYVEWRDRHSGRLRARELYDHSVDDEENVNIAERGDERLIGELHAQLQAGFAGAGS
jgi:hypothetical protein